MADRRFFPAAVPFALGDLAALTGATLSDSAQAGRRVTDVAPLDAAGPEDLSFLDNRKYLAAFAATRAGACFVRAEAASAAPPSVACLIHVNPYYAYAQAAQAMYPPAVGSGTVNATAVVDPAAEVGTGCDIGAYAVIGAGAVLGPGCRIGAHAVIGDGVVLGEGCEIGAHAVISHAVLGARVRVFPGACVGRPGFGFAVGPRGFLSVPQLGRVVIGDDVDIGANSTVDRGAGPDTVIGAGTRIDNLVQIAHNVHIGRQCVVVAQVGISGSTRIGDGVMIGGQAGLAGHVTIGDGARIAAQSGIMRDIPAGEEYMGSPAVPLRQNMRQVAALARLTDKKKKGDNA